MLYILLPVHNRKDITRRCVSSLQRQSFQSFHLVLLDDGSTDGTEMIVREHISAVSVVKGNGTWWWAGALQEGYRWLLNRNVNPSDLVLIMNDDNEFDADFLQNAVNFLQHQKRVLLASRVYGKNNGILYDAGVVADWKHWKFFVTEDVTQIDCLSTRALFMHAEDFFDIGGFYPTLLPHYSSDYEFTIRAKKKNYTLTIHPSVRTVLDESATGMNSLLDAPSYISFLQKLLSKKYMMNPLYMSAFIMLACPWRWKPLNLMRIWGSTAWKLVKYFYIFAFNRNR